jgi:hypothetical protein
MHSITTILSFSIISILAIAGWVLYFNNKRIVKQYVPYVVEVEKMHVGFDDICLDFVQALLVRGKMEGVKRLLDDNRLSLNDQENKLYYFMLRVVYNYAVKDIKEGRKWIEYTQRFYHNLESNITLEKDINKITHYVNEAIEDPDNKALVHDLVSLIKEHIDIAQFDRRYVAHLDKKQKHVLDKSKGFQSNNTKINNLTMSDNV